MLSINIDLINILNILSIPLLFYQIPVFTAVYPDNDAHEDKGHGRQQHEAVVHVAMQIGALGNYPVSPKRACSEQFPDERDDNQNESVP